jgi:hypothetical protein
VPPSATARRQQQPDPYAVLGVPRGCSRRQIRQQYIERIKLLHPDVSASLGEDTTAEAARLNAAYEALMEGGWEGWEWVWGWGGKRSHTVFRRRCISLVHLTQTCMRLKG